MTEKTLFERIGGQHNVSALADKFYDVMERDTKASMVLHMHPKDLTRSRKKLKNFLCEWFGGPKIFGEAYVNPEWLKLRHQHLNIGLEARDQWLHCMTTAMRELNYPPELHQELTNKFYEVAGYMRTNV